MRLVRLVVRVSLPVQRWIFKMLFETAGHLPYLILGVMMHVPIPLGPAISIFEIPEYFPPVILATLSGAATVIILLLDQNIQVTTFGK